MRRHLLVLLAALLAVAVLTPDGRWLAFCSTASDLLPQDTNATTGSYVWRMP